MEFYEVEDVRRAADGKWLTVLSHLSSQLNPAIQKVGRHVPCPVRGGKDGFRLMRNCDQTGAAFNNDPTVGNRGFLNNGFELLMWVNGWSFHETVSAVGKSLGVPPRKKFQEKPTVKIEPISNGRIREYFGEILEFGAAKFEFNDKNEASYYLKLRYASGFERVLWGVDLERVLSELGAKQGDKVKVRNLGRQAVKVTSEKRDSSGNVIGTVTLDTFRNVWEAVFQGEHSQGCATPENSDQSVASAEATKNMRGDSGKVYDIPKELKQPWLEEIRARLALQNERAAKASTYASENIRRTWNECLPFSGQHCEPMRLYLQSRGLIMSSVLRCDDMRFHPSLKCYEDEEYIGKFPAIVCAIRDVNGTILTLHRTYLSKKGTKAQIGSAKKLMSLPEGSTASGGAIQLGDIVNGVLGVAEGIETAWSATRFSSYSTWATVNAQMMETFVIPDEVHTLLIWADKDKSRRGEIAANVLSARAKEQGVKSIVLMPGQPIPAKSKGVDWNDVLLRQGITGFPPFHHLKRMIGLAEISQL